MTPIGFSVRTPLQLSAALLLLAGFVACDGVDAPTDSQSGAIQGSGDPCQVDVDCPSGEECDDSVCQTHVEDGAGGDDPAGDDNGAGGDDPAGDDNGAGGDDPAGDDNGAGGDDPGAMGVLCTTDADCPVGQECNDGACRVHGGG